jgi:putative glycosyltransferase (TIGR04348 family)
MRILIVTPEGAGSRKGNRVTAVRWVGLLRRLGHRVAISQRFDGQACDLLIALHARRSGEAVRRFRRERPEAPLVLVLAGTDLYRDLVRRASRRQVCEAMALADRLVTLNTESVRQVPARFRSKVRCILQSAPAAGTRPQREARKQAFLVCVIGHLRAEKDPLRPAYAARRLPRSSRIRIGQAGRALDPVWSRRAAAEMRRNPRYRWLGELSAAQIRRLLARADLLVHPSRMEGGANVVGEAVRAGLPVLLSRIPGNVGLLGRAYPGYFPLGATGALTRLLRRAETRSEFIGRLRRTVRRLAPRFSPAQEARGWRRLIADLG